MKKKQVLKLCAFLLCGSLAVQGVTALADEKSTAKSAVALDGDQAESSITAVDFEYEKLLGNMSDAFAIELGDVKATDASGNAIAEADIIVDKKQKKAINDAIEGTFPLTFSTADGATVTVQVKVNPMFDTLYASDFTYDSKDGALTADKAKELADVKGWTIKNEPISKSSVTVDAQQLAALNDGEDGTYDLTFSMSEFEDAEITVTKKTTEDVVDQSSLKAEDFAFEKTATNSLTEEQAKTLAKVTALDKEGAAIDNSKVEVSASELKTINDATTEGRYSLTFSYDNDLFAKVYVTLTIKGDDGGNTDDEENYTWDVDDFSYDLNDGDLTEAKAIEASGVKIMNTDGEAVADADITVDAAELAAINAVTEKKDCDLTFTCPMVKDTNSIVVTVSVTPKNDDGGNGGNEDDKVTYSITADNFAVNAADGALTQAQAIELAKAAVVSSDGKTVDDAQIVVNANQLAIINAAKESGSFDLTFTNSLATESKTIKVQVTVEKGEEERVYSVAAENFSYDLNNGILTTAKAIELAKAKAAVTIDGAAANDDTAKLVVDDALLAAINAAKESGNFDLTFSCKVGNETKASNTIKVQVTVPDEERVYMVDAEDFSYDLNSGDLTKAKAIELAKAKIAVTIGGAAGNDDTAQLVVDDAQLAAINAAKASGNFDLTFSCKVGNETKDSNTIKVAVTPKKTDDNNNDNNDDVEGKSKITAYDFNYDLANGVLTDTRAKAYASLKAFNEAGRKINRSDITVDEDELDDINNGKAGDEYTLTFTTPDKTEKIVVVTLRDTSATKAQFMAFIKDFLSAIFGFDFK